MEQSGVSWTRPWPSLDSDGGLSGEGVHVFHPFIPSHFWQAQARLSDPRDAGGALHLLAGLVCRREPAGTRGALYGVGDVCCLVVFSFPRSCICVAVLFQELERRHLKMAGALPPYFPKMETLFLVTEVHPRAPPLRPSSQTPRFPSSFPT